jgi:catechol 2,3-dioxygenase-like lactoylglutathione lyase family enzyme
VITGIDHVQVAAPPGCEPAARAFYGHALGLDELPKPEPLAGRGGCWFAAGDQQLHVGVASPFAAAAKAHPALRASSAQALRQLADTLAAAGHLVEWDDALAGGERFYVHDPFGNRVEIIAAAGSDGSAGTA